MNIDWCKRIKLQYPVVQAAMGGGIAGVELAGAVSAAGGLGTLGLTSARAFLGELKEVRSRCPDQPFAVNLLMPFVKRPHIDACLDVRPEVVSLFYGFDRALVKRLREAGILVLHQIGTPEQAVRALDEGAEGLIVQGSEAGGHLAGDIRLAALLPQIRKVVGPAIPLIAAGGIHDGVTAAAAVQAGADGIAAGTRFLLTPESAAHPEYKARLLAAEATLRTSLFGMGWPAPHRVVANAATARWCSQASPDGPKWAAVINTLATSTSKLLDLATVSRLVRWQRQGLPLYSPVPLKQGMDARELEVTPLYAGECVGEISQLASASDIVETFARALAPFYKV